MFRAFIMLILIGFFSACSGPASKSSLNQNEGIHVDWNKQIFYFVLLDRFKDGDASNNILVQKDKILSYHGGDFKGLLENYDHISHLGVNGILFTPLLDNRNREFYGHFALHGYWPVDHFKLDEHWGDWSDLDRFTKKRQDLKQTFLIDMVLNHVDWDHPWYVDHKEWFHELGTIKDWNDPKQLTEGQVTGLPDLKQENEEVYQLLMKYTTFWIDKTQPDGLRLDAIKHIDHRFWKRYIGEVRDYAMEKNGHWDFLFLGEHLHGDANTYLPFIDDGFNAFYNYPLYYTIKEVVAQKNSFYKLAERYQELDRIFDKSKITLMNFVDNHDVPRFLDLESGLGQNHLYQALSMAFFYPGISMVYYGTEEKMLGKDGESGRQSMTFRRDLFYKKLQDLISLRKDYADFLMEKRVELSLNDDQYAFSYSKGLDQLLFVYQRLGLLNNVEFDFPSDIKEVKSLFNGKTYKVVNQKLVLPALEYGFDLFYLEDSKGLDDSEDEIQSLTISLQAQPQGHYRLVGNLELAGAWNPKKGKKMSQKAPGLYECQIEIPKGKVLSYKFVKMMDDNVVWEDKIGNRYIFPLESATIKDSWNK